MPLTNRLALPAAFVSALENDEHVSSGADASVTELVGSARIGALRRAHRAEIVEDVADRIWSLYGMSMHTILEQAGRDLPDTLTEHEVWTECEGWRIVGRLDTHALLHGQLDDYKVCSWYGVKDGAKQDWVGQANLLALMLGEAGHDVRSAGIVAIIRDHRPSEAKRFERDGYPETPVMRVPVALWPVEQTRAYLTERVLAHQAARQALAEQRALVHCTREERWQRDPKWAVMKEGRQRAVKLCNSDAEAREVIGGAKGLTVEYRPGEAVRCGRYCSVRPWCVGLSDGQWAAGEAVEEEADNG